MPQKTRSSSRPHVLPDLTFAILSGSLLGCAFPPVDVKWLAWGGLVPLLWILRPGISSRRAFLLGYLAGLVFFLITLHPLVSAHSWTGWAAESPGAFASRMNRQWLFMQGIWASFALWCALFWGAWAVLLRRLAPSGGWRMLILAPSLWVLLPEWARAQTTFGFAWAFLGNATADVPTVRQLAAVGGVWLLSALVVVVNVGAAEALRQQPSGKSWRVPLAALGLLGFTVLGGTVVLRYRPQPDPVVRVAAIQYHQPEYDLSDFTDIGLDRNYLPMARSALDTGVRLVVLPESIALGAVSLDGTPSHTKPPEWQHPHAGWDAQATALLSGSSAVLVIGLDTVEQGRDHNTLVAWTAEGPAGWYHKRRLVPFSEYQPFGWGPWALRGRSQYDPGQGSQLIRAGDLILGGFICQEVLFPWVTRYSVRDGATILVTGGNDGVFGDPAVARVHADAAQIRAAETRRYIVRAMKTGISAIIDPYGRELLRSQSSEPLVLVQPIGARRDTSPYVRLGDWMVWLGAALTCLALVFPSPSQR